MSVPSGSASTAQASNGREEDEEVDYMSDAFLQSLQENSKTSERKSPERHINTMPKNRRRDAEIVLQEGLAKPLSEENIGFKLLAKMGYNKETGAISKGPIDIHLKRDRTGLGVEEETRKHVKILVEEGVKEMQAARESETAIKEQFLKAHAARFGSRHYRGQLIKLRRIEETLYEKQGMEPPPTIITPDPAEIDVEDVVEPSNDKVLEQSDDDLSAPQLPLPNITLVEPDFEALVKEKVSKLRSAPFFYCFYCGTQYADMNDLEQNCPGETEEAHE